MFVSDSLRLRVQVLELDLDLRLGTALLDALAWAPCDEDYVAAMLRFAYGRGYQDALLESPRGKLYLDHGIPVPKRQAKKK